MTIILFPRDNNSNRLASCVDPTEGQLMLTWSMITLCDVLVNR